MNYNHCKISFLIKHFKHTSKHGVIYGRKPLLMSDRYMTRLTSQLWWATFDYN